MAARAVVVVVLLSGVVSCKSGATDNDAEAGVQEDAGKPDSLFEATLAPTCSGEFGTICQDLDVYGCVDGKASEFIETCSTGACSLGRCTTTSCAKAEESDGMVGCRFYAVQVDNVDPNDGADLLVLLTNSSSTTAATIRIEFRSVSDGWQEAASDLIGPRAGKRFPVNRPAREVGLIQNGAFRITSDSPIGAAQIVNDDLQRDSVSTGGTALLPVQVLRNRYFAVTYPGKDSAAVSSQPGNRGGAGMIMIVGTEQGTVVHIWPTATMDIGGGNVAEPGGEPYGAGLNEGDVLQVFSKDPDGDLTGTQIEASSPIAVFSGNIFTSYGYDPSGWNGADLAIEQVPGYENWGKEYVGAWHAPQLGCDSFWGQGTGLWQVVAANDSTIVTLEPSAGTLFSMFGQPFDGKTFTLNRGQSRRFLAYPDPSKQTPGIVPQPTDFVARADHQHRILLAQWMDCEPALSFGIDTRFGKGDTVMVLPPGFDQEVLIVRPEGAMVTLSEVIDSQHDQKTVLRDFGLPFGTVHYQVARVNNLGASGKTGPCLSRDDRCDHTLSGAKFGVSWRGMDISCSYALTFPPGDVCVLGSGQCSSE